METQVKNNPTTYQLYVGVDIAAATFTAVHLRPDAAKPTKALNCRPWLDVGVAKCNPAVSFYTYYVFLDC